MGSKAHRIGRLHVLTDFYFQQTWGADRLAELAIRGGADTIQFRQKKGPIRHKIIEAERVARVCLKTGTTLIVDDHIDVCLGVGADGIHLGQEDFPVALARKVLGDDCIIGASATTLDQARQAWSEGADYIGFGPVFPSMSKDKMASVKGADALASVCAAVDIPVIAIAGISVERIEQVMRAGAYGVAVLRAVSGAHDPSAAASELRNELNRWVQVTTAAAS
ncbi:MAG TPA: thiamine phosphate synthase [Rhodothermales bacterium]|nr:thiamine phosphate synthase [Rhodothermales bacterium]